MNPEEEIQQNANDLIRAFGSSLYWNQHERMRPNNQVNQDDLKALISRILDLLTDRRCPSISLECLRIASGLSTQSYQSLSDVFGVSKQAICLRVHAFTESLGLPPAGMMYSDKEKAVYATNGAVKKLVVGG